jgi:1,4-dihydroxy-2-naphthoyl-CoA synthase
MSYQDIIFEKSGQIGIITLNRPDRLNAFTWTMGNEMRDGLGRAAELMYTGRILNAREGVVSFIEKRKPAWSMKVPGDMPDF